MIDAASVLTLLHLAQEFGFNPEIKDTGESFEISYYVAGETRNTKVLISKNDSSDFFYSEFWEYDNFNHALNSLKERKGSLNELADLERERQDALDKLTDHERKILGLID